MSLTLQDLFDTYAISSYAKQMRLNDLVGEDDWGLDVETATLSFSSGPNWSVQILGSESFVSDTWLWGWANEHSDLPPSSLRFAKRVHSFGEEHDIDELIEPDIPLDWGDGETLSLIALGICEAAAFYRCPHDNGAVFVIIDDVNYPTSVNTPVDELPQLILDALACLEIKNHRLAVTAFLKAHGSVVAEFEDRIEVALPKKPLKITFDTAGRVGEITTAQQV